jgi:hypothetical protein
MHRSTPELEMGADIGATQDGAGFTALELFLLQAYGMVQETFIARMND